MRKIILFLVFILYGLLVSAQNIDVKSFKALPSDMTASSREGRHIDQNGEVAALIRVVTTESGFSFEGGSLGIIDTRQQVSEIWVWVPRGLRKISIFHPYLGVLRDYVFPVEIEAERTYEMTLVTGKVETKVRPSVTEQFLVFNVTPKDAMVTVDDVPWPVNDGVAQKLVPFGTYEYRIEAPDYHTSAGKVTVNDANQKSLVKEDLRPAFGYLKVEGDNAILSKSSIYIDNASSNKAIHDAVPVPSGSHKVRVVHPMYKPYEQSVSIKDDETYTLKIDLNANYSTVTIMVDADAEIYVNDERKGLRSWTGDLVAGNYLIEGRMKNHNNTNLRIVVTDDMNGQVIQLDPPTPITGRLVLSSTPSMATLFVDDEPMGETPMQLNDLIIGEHRLRLEKAGFASSSKTVVIEEGQTLSLEEQLESGGNVMVKTDREGDEIVVDGTYVGLTPMSLPLGFGTHTIKVTRDRATDSKTVEITPHTGDQELMFGFGRLVTIRTDHDGDQLTVDGKPAGTSPLTIDLSFGMHTVQAKRDNRYAEKEIHVFRSGGVTEHYLVLRRESASHFVSSGVNFVTINYGYGSAPQSSFGFSVGSVNRFGWFFTAMSNFQFDALRYEYTSDASGYVAGELPEYTGASCTTRLSLMAGAVAQLIGPLCARAGVGYGSRVKSWYTADGELVRVADDSFRGLDASVGLQLNFKGLVLSLEAVTTNFQIVEGRLGIGYCWKRNKQLRL